MNRSLVGVFLLFFILALVVVGAFYGGIAYVFIHFIHKFW